MIKMIRLAAGGDAGVRERHLGLEMMTMMTMTETFLNVVIPQEDLVHVLPKERDPYLETMTNGKIR